MASSQCTGDGHSCSAEWLFWHAPRPSEAHLA